MSTKKPTVRPGVPFAMQSNTALTNAQFQQALHHHSQGQLAQAKLLCETILQSQPHHVHGLHLLALISIQNGAFQSALELFDKALKLAPKDAALHCNQANAYAGLQQYDAAIACYGRAIAIQGGYVDAHYGWALALLKLGQFEQAFERFTWILNIRPGLPQAIAGQELALRCHATALAEQGKPELAIHYFIRALALHETLESKQGFAKCAKDLAVTSTSSVFHELLVRAISEAWTRPTHLTAVAIRVMLLNDDIRDCVQRANDSWPKALSFNELFGATGIDALTNEPLIRCILENVPVTSIAFERLFTQVRRVLLDWALDVEASPETAASATSKEHRQRLLLLSSIARQCYINEYVFHVSDDELVPLASLRERIVQRLRGGQSVPPIWLAAVGAYISLNTLEFRDQLVSSVSDESVLALVQQQILEPEREREIRSTIARLTSVDDAVSVAVQDQYEANPYPRWVKICTTTKPSSIETVLRRQFEQAPFRPLANQGNLEVLIAGCGTGQQPIEALSVYQNARLLAVDLSLASLSYAKRKTEEIGLQNIEYANADILQLGSINREFDVIESVGVLHHIADPLSAWKVLVGLLRPGGLMRLGFYSELARQCIVSARQFIAERGYPSDAASIRRCRQDMMSPEMQGRFDGVFAFKDFFSVSDCRDLLFHIQEQRFTIPQLKDALHSLGLDFIGFSVEATVVNRYLSMFPQDPARTNLDNWHRLELEYPDTFIGMYQFWVQKRL